MNIATDLTRHFAALSTSEAEAAANAINTAASVALANHDTTLYATLTSAAKHITSITTPDQTLTDPMDMGADDGWVLARPKYRPSDTSSDAEAYRNAYTEAANDRIWAILNERA